MKAAPVVAACSADDQVLIHTGQHYDPVLSQVFFDELDLPEPDRYLGVGSGSHGAQTARLIEHLESQFLDLRPSQVVVYGDVNSTLAATLVAAKLGIPVAHVEAGLRSFDRTMPEEINRIVTDSLAEVHFATSPEAIGFLADEGLPVQNVHLVGNPMIDTLQLVRPQLDPEATAARYGLDGPYGLVTLHRPGNVDDPGRASSIVHALGRIGQQIPLVFPVHPRGRKALSQVGLEEAAGVMTTEPLSYLEFTSLMSGASVVLTDSGGVQEETTMLDVPCFTVRPNTERPITLTHGTNRLVEPAELPAAVGSLLDGEIAYPEERPPLWDGRAGARIASILDRW